MNMKQRYAFRKVAAEKYAVNGFQAARWCVFDRWRNNEIVGYGIRRYDAIGIVKFLNVKKYDPITTRRTVETPYWEWRQPGDYHGVRNPHALLADHKNSYLGANQYASDEWKTAYHWALWQWENAKKRLRCT